MEFEFPSPWAFVSTDSGKGLPGTPTRRVGIEVSYSIGATVVLPSEALARVGWAVTAVASEVGLPPPTTIFSVVEPIGCSSYTTVGYVGLEYIPGVSGCTMTDLFVAAAGVTVAASLFYSTTSVTTEADGSVLRFVRGEQHRYPALLGSRDIAGDLVVIVQTGLARFDEGPELRPVRSPSRAGRLLKRSEARIRGRPRVRLEK